MIKVMVCGSEGKMGQAVVAAVNADPELEYVAGIDPTYAVANGHRFSSVEAALIQVKPDVMVDFTRPDVVAGNVATALDAGIDCVVGTTGLSEDDIASLGARCTGDTCLFIAPNFAIGAVLLMKVVQEIAHYLPHAEVIEYHHDRKLDAPSGTALRTAKLIAAARENEPVKPGSETELPDCAGARGADVDGITIHSVRLPGLVAHQEVIFGGEGQTLTVRHDSIDRTSFMPGVVLACKKVGEHRGVVVGLEHFMEEE